MATSILSQATPAPKARTARAPKAPASTAAVRAFAGMAAVLADQPSEAAELAPAALRLQSVHAAAPAPSDTGPDGDVWGHLGVRFPGTDQSRWFPLSEDQADAVTAQLHSGAPWLAVTTLDGRAVLIHAKAVQRLALLDDGADEPDEDWWHADHGAGLDARDSRVHYASGAAEPLTVDPAASWGAFDAVEKGGELPPVLCLSCSDDGLSVFVAPDRLAMLDMPLQRMLDGEQDELAQLRAESSRRALLKRAA